MSIVMYKIEDGGWFYCVEINMPEDTVAFGEGHTPAEAVRSRTGTQYQGAYFGCTGPSNERLTEYFGEYVDDEYVIVDCSGDEEDEAELEYASNG